MFMWGFAYWGSNPLPYKALSAAPSDEAAGRAIREHFPASGTYILPSPLNTDQAAMTKLHESGPVAILHLTARDGAPVMDPIMMAKGFVQYLVMGAILIAILGAFGGPSFGSRLKLGLAIGVAAAVMVDVGDMVWWRTAVGWKLWQLAYTVSGTLVGSAVAAAFTGQAKAVARATAA